MIRIRTLGRLPQHDMADRGGAAGGAPQNRPQAGEGPRGRAGGTAEEGGVKLGKRGNGEGTISRRKNGGWMAQYYVHTADGRKRKTLYGKTSSEATKKLNRALSDRADGIDDQGLTVGEYLDRWLRDVRDTVRKSTTRGASTRSSHT